MTERPKSVVIDEASRLGSERFCFCGVAFLAAAAALDGAALDGAALDEVFAAATGEAFAGETLEGADRAFCGGLADGAACFSLFFTAVLGVSAVAFSASSFKGCVALEAECPSLDSIAFLNTNLIVAARASTAASPSEDWGCMRYDNPQISRGVGLKCCTGGDSCALVSFSGEFSYSTPTRSRH